MARIGKSACDQCSYCTEFCPRYLLGYDVQPHKVMRSLSFTATGADIWNRFELAVRGQGEPAVSVRGVLPTMALMDGARESSRQGCAVDIADRVEWVV